MGEVDLKVNELLIHSSASLSQSDLLPQVLSLPCQKLSDHTEALFAQLICILLSHSSHFSLFILETLHCMITRDYVYLAECKYPVCLWLLVCAIIFQTWWEFDSTLLHPAWHPFCPECACHRTLFCVNIECLIPRRIYDVFIMGLMTTQATRFSYPGQQVLRSRTMRSDTDVTWLDG